MTNAIATFTAVLDIGSASMIHWNGEAVRAHVGSQSAGPIKLNFRFRCPRRCALKVRNRTTKVLAIYVVERDKPVDHRTAFDCPV